MRWPYFKRALRKFKPVRQPPFTSTSTKNVWHTRKITRLTTDPSIRAHTTQSRGAEEREGLAMKKTKGFTKLQ